MHSNVHLIQDTPVCTYGAFELCAACTRCYGHIQAAARMGARKSVGLNDLIENGRIARVNDLTACLLSKACMHAWVSVICVAGLRLRACVPLH
jgi:hypothetical protein